MKKIFEKNETLMTILIIVAYVVVNSYCMQNWGRTDYRSVVVNTVFSIALLALVISLKRVEHYGLVNVVDWKKYLYFIPLIIISTTNLWHGININYTSSEIIFYILTMINIGFLEEIIFRGFLFKMMAKDNVKSAIVVSSVTFGLGHIVNLINGAEFVPTLMQVCYAISLGYMFVIIFYKSKSIMPCILSHMLINSLSIFNDGFSYVTSIFLIVAPVAYATYINKKVAN